MQRASQAVSPADREAVCRAVAAAEARTAAEIVPVVATASGRYDRAEDIVGLWLGAIALLVVWGLWPHANRAVGTWGDWTGWFEPVSLVGGLVAGFVAGATLASRIGWLCVLFTPRSQLRAEVQARARQAFFDARVHHARAAGGLLLYVSLLERRAVVLADANIETQLGPAELEKLCEQLTSALARGAVAEALCQTIGSAGDKLAAVLPRQANDVNELPDALVILDRPL